MEKVFTAPTFLIRTSFGETLGCPLGTLDADKVAQVGAGSRDQQARTPVLELLAAGAGIGGRLALAVELRGPRPGDGATHPWCSLPRGFQQFGCPKPNKGVEQ
jgi:hypothetical protein